MTPYPIRRSGLLLLALLTPLASLRAEEISPRELLRDALYAEEVTRDPGKAAESYEKVLELYEAERPFAATALFRLAEVRRKQGNKEEAAKLYQRLLQEFPGAEVEGKLARENLATLGGAIPEATATTLVSDEESKEFQRLQELIRTSPDLARDSMLLDKAASAGHLRVMTLLIDSGIDPKTDFILNSAVASGNLKAVELLLSKRDPATPPTGWALKQAVQSGYLSIAKLLLKSGVKADFRYEVKSVENGYAPTTSSLLHLAAAKGDKEMCQLLLDQGADLNFMPELCYPSKGFSDTMFPVGAPLHQAIAGDSAKSGSLAIMLMKAGAKPDPAASGTGLTPLHLAAARGNLPVIKALLEAGVEVNPRSTMPDPLPSARRSENTSGPRPPVLRGGGNPWESHQAGKTPLHDAVYAGHEEAARLLLSKGADPNAVTATGSSVIANALSSNKALPMVKLLVETGAKPTSADDFVTATRDPSLEVVELLLRAGADVNAFSPYHKKTALQAAVEARHSPEMVRFLIDHGAKLDEAQLESTLQNTSDEIREILHEHFLLPGLLAKPAITLVSAPYFSFQRDLATREGDLAPPPLEALLLKASQLPFIEVPWDGINPGLGSAEILPRLVTILRKEPGGAIRKFPARIDGSAPLPKLEWGDVVEFAPDPASFSKGIPGSYNVSYHEVKSPEIFWNLRKQLAVPIIAHIDGKAHEMTLRGDCLVYHPGETVAPLLRARGLAGVLWSHLVPDYLTIRRAGWPEIRIAKDNAEFDKFEFQPGDEVSPGYKEDPAALASKRREGKVTLSVPGTGFGISWWAIDPETIATLDKIDFGQAKLAVDPRSVPSLVEIITHTYAGRPRSMTGTLPEGDDRRWGELAMRQQGRSFGTPSDAEGFGVLTIPQDPDLSKIRLLRKGPDGKETVQEIDLTKAIAATTDATTAEEARRGDVWLQAGDEIEIPLKPQTSGKAWTGFNEAEVRFFSKVLSGAFQFSDANGNLSRKSLVWQPVKWLPSSGGPVPFPPDQGVASTITQFQEEIGTRVPSQLTRGGEVEREMNRAFFIRDGDRIRMERPNASRPPVPQQPQPQPESRPSRQRVQPPSR